MKIFTDIENFKLKNPVVTVGTFDGVHIGHQKLLKELISESKNVNGSSTVFTFMVHPRKILYPEQHLEFLNSNEEKQILLEKSGLENLIFFDFTKNFSELSAYDFVKEILVDKLKIRKLIFGYNHQFGKDRSGNFDSIRNCAKQFNFEVKKIDAELDNEIEISSTVIRKALQTGDLITANKYLGYNYFVRGIVVSGNKLGHKIGFPTANISIPKDKLIPLNGVYAATVEIENNQYSGMLNLGFKPTILPENDKKNIEVNIFNFDENIYGKQIKINFIGRIRDEIKFENLEMLKNQLITDKNESLKILSKLNY